MQASQLAENLKAKNYKLEYGNLGGCFYLVKRCECSVIPISLDDFDENVIVELFK